MNDDRTNLHPMMTGIDRPVLNKTGLMGTYFIALRFAPEEDYKVILERQLGVEVFATEGASGHARYRPD